MRLAVIAGSLLLLVGSTSCSARPTATGCRFDSECQAPLLCRDGQCLSECLMDRDCRNAGERCLAGLCRVPVDMAVADAAPVIDATTDAGSLADARSGDDGIAVPADSGPDDQGPGAVDQGTADVGIDAALADAATADSSTSDLGASDAGTSDAAARPDLGGRDATAPADLGIADLGVDAGVTGGDAGCPCRWGCVNGLCDRPVEIGAGLHTCVRTESGRVVCWGGNAAGQLGLGFNGASRPPSAAVVGLPLGVAQLAVGDNHACALLVDGRLYCWGSGLDGVIGDGGTSSRNRPVLVLSGVAEVRLGRSNTCVRTAALGEIVCWGRGSQGVLGAGVEAARTVPGAVVPGISGATGLAVGGSHACALLSSGSVQCWGSRRHGALGDGLREDTFSAGPVSVLALTDAVALRAGADHACARRQGGSVVCWGIGTAQANGSGAASPQPVAVLGLPSATLLSFGTGAHTCALGTSLVCWGSNFQGQIGDDSNTTRNFATLVDDSLVSGTLAPVVAVAAGNNHTCAVRGDGAVFCWGDNGFDALTGNGSDPDRPRPGPAL